MLAASGRKTLRNLVPVHTHTCMHTRARTSAYHATSSMCAIQACARAAHLRGCHCAIATLDAHSSARTMTSARCASCRKWLGSAALATGGVGAAAVAAAACRQSEGQFRKKWQ